MRCPMIVKVAIKKKERSYWEDQRVMNRAMRNEDAHLFAAPELIKKRLIKGMPIYGATTGGGAALGILGAALSKGRLNLRDGGIIGAGAGSLAGLFPAAKAMNKVTREHLAGKGIKYNKFGKITEMTPEAKKKYIR